MAHVDLYYTNIQDWDIPLLRQYLIKEEETQFESIRHEQTLKQKIVNRALLRRLLAERYVERAQIVFEYNDKGKPYLKNHPSLYFNSTHSNDLVLIGISTSCLIGVDVEWIHPLPNEEEIAQHFFSDEEYVCYIHHKQFCDSAFFQFWTAKEAIIKALGKGLWESDRVPKVLLDNGELTLENERDIHQNWTLVFPNIHEEYLACLAANHFNITVNTLELKARD